MAKPKATTQQASRGQKRRCAEANRSSVGQELGFDNAKQQHIYTLSHVEQCSSPGSVRCATVAALPFLRLQAEASASTRHAHVSGAGAKADAARGAFPELECEEEVVVDTMKIFNKLPHGAW